MRGKKNNYVCVVCNEKLYAIFYDCFVLPTGILINGLHYIMSACNGVQPGPPKEGFIMGSRTWGVQDI